MVAKPKAPTQISMKQTGPGQFVFIPPKPVAAPKPVAKPVPVVKKPMVGLRPPGVKQITDPTNQFGGSPAKAPTSTKVTTTSPFNDVLPAQEQPVDMSYGNETYGPNLGTPPVAVAPQYQPPPPSLEDWLAGDTTYQDQTAQLRKAYMDYTSNQALDVSNYQQQMGDQQAALKRAQTQDSTSNEDDFAARGMLRSGGFGKAYSDIQTDYTGKQSGLETARQQYLNNQNAALTDFKSQQENTSLSAKQQAIARRAAKFNLGA